MWSKEKGARWKLALLIGVPVLTVLAAVAVWLFAFHLPYVRAENTMDPRGTLELREQTDGTLLLQWPAGENAQQYVLTAACGDEILFETEVSQPQCLLPSLPTDETVTLTVASRRAWHGGIRMGTQDLQASLYLNPPAVVDLQWMADPQSGALKIEFSQDETMSCDLYTSQNDAEPVFVQQIRGGKAGLTFGETGDYPVPPYGTERKFWFAVTLQGENWTFYGKTNMQLGLTREDFLGTRLNIEWERGSSNVYTLRWNETKGERYEVQMSADGISWRTLGTVANTEAHSYTTEPLDAFTDYRFRVLALGGQTLPDSEYAAEPAEVELSTQERALRSTIWAHKELEVFSDPQMTQPVGKVTAGKAFCLLEEVDGAFGIRWDDGVGYIDSNYCMINLPEYLGDLCLYDITNSYSSLYMVHEFGIDKVSGEVIKGYEKIKLGPNRYVVPLLYPAAKKLVTAAQAAVEQGYRLKIYDSFRPNVATLDIYELAQDILDDPVPVKTFSGKTVDDLDKLRWDPEAAEESQTDETEPVWEGILKGLTYEILMTDDGRWGLYNFLAQGVSNHNRGIAMDLTLVTLEGKELKMQTSMHDLSWYSEAARNNANAYLLRQIMVDAGFGGLGSEWWHYQDNDARDNLNPPALYWGVNIQCWMYDGDWRYRSVDGTYLTDCTQTIDGVSYTFDSQGYATAQE